MANHFKQMQADLERLGYEYASTNTRGGETWEHPAHSLVIYPSMREDAHRSLLRSCKKRLGVKEETNKRKPDQIKDRQAKDREAQRAAWESHQALLDARINQIEMARSIAALSIEDERRLRELLREREELRRLMSQTPTG